MFRDCGKYTYQEMSGISIHESFVLLVMGPTCYFVGWLLWFSEYSFLKYNVQRLWKIYISRNEWDINTRVFCIIGDGSYMLFCRLIVVILWIFLFKIQCSEIVENKPVWFLVMVLHVILSVDCCDSLNIPF